MIKFLLWCILLVLCWPLALLALLAWPVVWLLLLPFRRGALPWAESLSCSGPFSCCPPGSCAQFEKVSQIQGHSFCEY